MKGFSLYVISLSGSPKAMTGNGLLQKSPLTSCIDSQRDKQQGSARISKDLTSPHTHCLLGMDSKQEVQPAQRPRKAHCHQLHFNNFKGSPPPSFPQQNVTLQHFLTDVHKIPQWPHASCCCSSESSLGLELAAVKGRFTQLLVSLRSQSWIIAAEAVQWFSDKIIYCQKKKKK